MAFDTSGSAGAAPVPPSTTDLPDELFLGAQVHMIYALPSDGADPALDTDGTAAASVSNFQGWLNGTNRRPMVASTPTGGQVDITFHRFTETDAQLAAYGINLRDAIESPVARGRVRHPTAKLYSVYYDGTGPHDHCGGGAWPPDLPGTVSAIYLRATFGSGYTCYDPVSLSRTRAPDHGLRDPARDAAHPWASFRAVRLIRPVPVTRPRRPDGHHVGRRQETGIRRYSTTATTITSTPTGSGLPRPGRQLIPSQERATTSTAAAASATASSATFATVATAVTVSLPRAEGGRTDARPSQKPRIRARSTVPSAGSAKHGLAGPPDKCPLSAPSGRAESAGWGFALNLLVGRR